MMQPVEVRDVVERLERLKAAGNLAKVARQTATTLVSRLTSPVRVTLLGPCGAGKSTLRDVLAGAAVVPTGQKLPTTMLRYGKRESITVTLGNRSVRSIEGLDFSALSTMSPAFVEIKAPLRTLESINLLEVVTNGSPGELAAALKWAATQTDIAIWVTTEFGDDEKAIWARMPDGLKDHAYLVQNKIDLLEPHEREAQNARMQDSAAQAFRSCFAMSAASTQTAPKQGDPVMESGCVSLLKSLKRHVDLASQADLDSALMLLDRYEVREKPPVPRAADLRKTEEPLSVQDASGKDQTKTPSPGLHLEKIGNPLPQRDEAMQRDARQAALECIRNCATGLLADWTYLSGDIAETVLDRCAQATNDLSATLASNDQLHESAQQANDLIVLLQLENSDVAAENAVTTLLQLKRDFEVRLAA